MTESVNAIAVLEALSTGSTASFVGGVQQFAGVHPAPGQVVRIDVTLELRGNEKEEGK